MFYQKGHKHELEIGEATLKAFNMEAFFNSGFIHTSLV